MQAAARTPHARTRRDALRRKPFLPGATITRLRSLLTLLLRHFGAQAAGALGIQEPLAEWQSLLRSRDGVPLVKTVVDDHGGVGGVYQFTHLSFQEGLSVIAMVQNASLAASTWASDVRRPLIVIAAPAPAVPGIECLIWRLLQTEPAPMCS